LSLTKQFGGLQAVGGVSFDIGEGQIIGLVGPSGLKNCSKTCGQHDIQTSEYLL
jgi:ABC-type branched-subunit amino acid transport system ATPase component